MGGDVTELPLVAASMGLQGLAVSRLLLSNIWLIVSPMLSTTLSDSTVVQCSIHILIFQIDFVSFLFSYV